MLERGKMAEIAKRLGVSKQYVSMIFKGERSINGETVIKILEIVPELEGKFAVKEWNKIRYIYKED